MGNLTRMMNHVAGNDRFLSARSDVYADVSRGMAGGGLQPDLVVHAVIGPDQVG